MKCRECPDHDHKTDGRWLCKVTGSQIGEDRLDTDRPCAHRKPCPTPCTLFREGKCQPGAEPCKLRPGEAAPVVPSLCPVAENPENVEPNPGPEETIEACAGWLKRQRAALDQQAIELTNADELIQHAHAAYGFSPETAEIAQTVKRITEKRLVALREAS